MVRMSKKAIGAISVASAAVIAGGVVTASVLIKNNKSHEEEQEEKSKNPLNRDKSYHQYSIVNKIKTNTKLTDLIRLQKIDNAFFYIIDETKFQNTIKTIIQEALQAIPLFSTNWNSYKIIVTYKIENASLVKVDVVWYLPDAKVKYFDQFELLLQVV